MQVPSPGSQRLHDPAGYPHRYRRLLWLSVALPTTALLIVGIRLVAQEKELEKTRRAQARASVAAEVSRAIVAQLHGILVSEAMAERTPEYVESATALVGRLTPRGLALPWQSAAASRAADDDAWILRGRSASPAACRARLAAGYGARAAMLRARCDDLERAERLAADGATLAAVRGAFGESRIVSWDGGKWVVAMEYVDTAYPLLVAVRTPSLVRAAGVILGDSLAIVGEPWPDAVPLVAGLDGFWLAWTGPPAGATWNGTLAYLVATMVLLLVVASLGGYLVDRDVRRTLHLTHLRHKFVAGVSHDLKTPLTAIRMYADTLRDGRVKEPARDEYLATIVSESERLGRLVDNVLDFSRIEHGERIYRFTNGDLTAIARNAIAILRHPIEQRGFDVQLTVAGHVPAVRCDADAIERAVLNLLSNAMVALPIDSLPLGSLGMAVRDPQSGMSGPPATLLVTISDQWMVANYEEVLDYLVYIASSDEIDRLRSAVTPAERRAVWEEFWTRRDPVPASPVNEYREEFFERVRVAAEQFAEIGRPGWRTDRGEVYIVLGAPDRVAHGELDARDISGAFDAIEWTYERGSTGGRMVLLFLDREGFGRYEMTRNSELTFRSIAGRLRVPSD